MMFRNVYLYGSFVLLVLSCKGDRAKRDFFKGMPEKYVYNEKPLDEKTRKKLLLENGLSTTSETINGKQYYHLFEGAEKSMFEMFSGYIRMERNAIYFLPNDYGKETGEQKLFDFNQKEGDSLFIVYGRARNKIKLVLGAIRWRHNDSIYTYSAAYDVCDDCGKLVFFSVGLKSGFINFYFKRVYGSGYTRIVLTSTEIKFDPGRVEN